MFNMKLYTPMKRIGAAVAAVSLSLGVSSVKADIDYADPAIKGSYEGIVYGEDMVTPVGALSLKISKKGSFSGKLSGYAGARSKMKGLFDPAGHYSGQQYNADGLSSNADMIISDAGMGYHRVTGILTTVDDRQQYYVLKRAIYSKTVPTELAGNYTALMPSEVTDSQYVPAGDGLAYGSVKTTGKIKLKGYSNAGNKFSYSGAVLEGDIFAFYTKPKNSRGEAIVGEIAFEEIAGVSDMSGAVRNSQLSGKSGASYAAGFDQALSFIGSRYVSAGFVQIPAQGFDSFANNAIASFTGGLYDAQSYVFTWQSRGSMAAPKLPVQNSKGKMKNKTGLFTVEYTTRDSAAGFAKTKSKVRGVVLQSQDRVSGQAVTGIYGSSRYTVIPNDTGEVAPSTNISPKKKKLSADQKTYTVDVVVDTAWQVVIPDEVAEWVEVDVETGTGNGQVEITVLTNVTGLPREANLKIAGLNHKIEQDITSDNGTVVEEDNGENNTITPTNVTMDFAGGVYEVEVEAIGDWDVVIPVGLTWVLVDPTEDTGDGTVNVTITQNPSFFFSRQTTILIAGQPHTIVQFPEL